MKPLEVHLYSHFFKVKPQSEKERKLCIQFAHRYITHQLQPAGGGRMERKVDKVYAASNTSRTEFRFHFNALEDWKDFLKANNYNQEQVVYIEHPFTPKHPVEIDIKVKPGWEPRDYQVPVIEYIKDVKIKPNKLITLATGQGKMESVYNRIRVPDGWKQMGDIKLGDEVIAWDGSKSKVTGVFPQGLQDAYKLTIRDGRSVTVGDYHLWTVYTDNRNQKNRDNHPLGAKYCDMTTVEMKRLIEGAKDYRIYLPLNKSEQNQPKDFVIDPYVLGVLIGDGSFAYNNITITKNDDFIFEEVGRRLPVGVRLIPRTRSPDKAKIMALGKEEGFKVNLIKEELERLGLFGCRSWEKFIPEIYLNGSTEQRLDLVRGLLDTDGCAEKDGTIEFSTTSPRLIDDFRELIFSLGGQATRSSRITKFTDKYGDRVPGRLSYRSIVRHPKPSNLFLLPRKKERTNDNNQYSPTLKSRVSSVEKLDEKVEMQCISIDHPDQLYLTENYLPTHNTFCAMQSAADIKMRTLFMLRPAFMDKWVEDLLKTYVIKPEDIAVVKGGAQLMALFAMFNNPRLKESDLPKFIILSNKTYQLYLKNYEQYGEEILEQGYDCLPEDMYEHLGVGIRFIDEVHLDFHLNFKADLYTNIPYTASMTASLITSDPELSRMYFTAYPTNQRYKAPPPKRYIEARGLLYRTSEKEQPRISWPNRKDYAHGAYEQWLMKRPGSLKRYFEMIKHVIDGEYIENYREGDRLLVFCYSIKMATLLSDFLAETYPQHSVKRYVEDDEYNNVLEPDMRVSTVLSAGTGIDIPKLRLAILTTAINSEKSNIQSLGRLRELKDDDRPPVFYWFTNERIPKHVYYHRAKKELFQPLTKSVADRYYDKEI